MSRFAKHSGDSDVMSNLHRLVQECLHASSVIRARKTGLFLARDGIWAAAHSQKRLPGDQPGVGPELARQTSTKLRCAQVLRPSGRNTQHAPFPLPHPTPQRPAAGLHELAGRPLPGRVAGDDPSLDGRGPRELLPDARRSAALLAGPARRLHRLDAPRRPCRSRIRDGAPGRKHRLSGVADDRPAALRTERRGAPRASRQRRRRAQLARRPNFSRRRR